MSKKAKCLECGKWYEIYTYYSGDQSACPRCRLKRKIEWSDESMADCECIPCFKGEDNE